MGKLSKSQFAFRRSDRIGAAGAEQDDEYLTDCFFDRGDLTLLRDPAKSECIIVGRTGTGKTALLRKLGESEPHVIELDPDHLSLHFLADTAVLRWLETLDVNLSLFYKLLWRHVLAVEFIKSKYSMRSETDAQGFLRWLTSKIVGDSAKQKAVDYLVDWGRSFWQDTEIRVKEITSKLEREIKNSAGLKFSQFAELASSGSDKLSVEEKAEVKRHAQEVVNTLQVRELTTVLKLLAEEVFNQAHPRYHISIDKLDESWVPNSLRYRLIKALIETARELNSQLAGAKVLIAIRRDLFDRVIQETRDSGFQEEKYTASLLQLRWSRDDLFALLDSRVNKLVRHRYTQKPVGWRDVLPERVNKKLTIDYLVERTMYRPRDLITFFNCCIQQAVDRPEITAQMISLAESEYSEERLRSLRDEWGVDYPELLDCVSLLKKKPQRFRLATVTSSDVNELCLRIATRSGSRGAISQWADERVNETLDWLDFRARLFWVFYRVGLVGLKIETFTPDAWSFFQTPLVQVDNLRDDTSVAVCPMFYRTLGIVPEATGATGK